MLLFSHNLTGNVKIYNLVVKSCINIPENKFSFTTNFTIFKL